MRQLLARTAMRPREATEEKSPSTVELVSAFNELRYELLSTLFFLLGDCDEAQDALQNAFLKCWKHRGRLGGVRNLRAWIYRVSRNCAADLQRNAWRRRVRPLRGSEGHLGDQDASPLRTIEEHEKNECLREALMTLRPEEKEVFLLRQNGCLTYEEIARMRRMPVGTVKTQMRTALGKLRRILSRPEEG